MDSAGYVEGCQCFIFGRLYDDGIRTDIVQISVGNRANVIKKIGLCSVYRQKHDVMPFRKGREQEFSGSYGLCLYSDVIYEAKLPNRLNIYGF